MQKNKKDQGKVWQDNVAEIGKMAAQMAEAGMTKEEITNTVGKAASNAGDEVWNTLYDGRVLHPREFNNKLEEIFSLPGI